LSACIPITHTVQPNAEAERALGLQKLEPCPLAIPGMTTRILPADYDPHLEQLADCGLVIEAIVERVDLKQDFYPHITPYLDPGAILLSNASGPSNWLKYCPPTCGNDSATFIL
jgi:3-hydroxyacyl-CoA dehydrogenase